MPSFDIVNKINIESFKNAINAVNKEVSTRYDFKDSDSKIELKDNKYNIIADSDLKLKQIKEILSNHLVRQNVNTKSISFDKEEASKESFLIEKGSQQIARLSLRIHWKHSSIGLDFQGLLGSLLAGRGALLVLVRWRFLHCFLVSFEVQCKLVPMPQHL